MITIAIRRSLALLVLLSPAAAIAQAPRSGPPAGTTRSGAANPAALPADYQLVVGDKLRIEVYKDPQLSQSVQVRPDGKITLPLIGDIAAAGATSTRLRDAITGSLKEYVTNPVVTVIVVETQPQTFSVMGEVNNPGPQAMTGAVTVIEALAAAGGFKDF